MVNTRSGSGVDQPAGRAPQPVQMDPVPGSEPEPRPELAPQPEPESGP
jgi:hypothetical protein